MRAINSTPESNGLGDGNGCPTLLGFLLGRVKVAVVVLCAALLTPRPPGSGDVWRRVLTYPLMSIYRPLSNIAFTIKTHLRTGGDIHDDLGMTLAERYVEAAEKIPSIKGLMDEFEMNRYDLLTVLLAGIDSLMPNPCVRIPVEALASSLVFQEPDKHLHQILMMADIRHHTIPDGENPSAYKRGALYHWTSSRMLEIKLAHDMAYGPADFKIVPAGGLPSIPKSGGCLGLLVACGTFIAGAFVLASW